jgi:hypothetical protein
VPRAITGWILSAPDFSAPHDRQNHASSSYDARPRTGCYVCRYHGGELPNGHIRCAAPDGRTMGYPARGCAYWQREPGGDDE